MKILVIGAGAAGLVAAKYALQNNHDCVVIDMRSELGGTWVYTDDVDLDKYGFPVYSATYKSLKANIPKEVMGYPDFPISDKLPTYPTHNEMKEFLKDYADYNNLNKLFKFNCIVTKIEPINKHQWMTYYTDKVKKLNYFEIFDVVMLCSGNYNEGNMPKNIKGTDIFKGDQFHSRQYRSPDNYKNKIVLIIGAGPSGVDLALEISTTAKAVLLSNHSDILTSKYPDNVHRKPDIKEIFENDVEFVDGNVSKVDVIFYCTGFNYSYPYLHESCGIRINDNHITPLYKHMIHMERPTMCMIGIPVHVCAFPMFDLQCRFYMKYLNGEMHLPSLEVMRKEEENEINTKMLKGYRERDFHKMGCFQQEYYDSLANLAGIKSLPPVIAKVRDCSFKRFYENLMTYRSDRYKIVDDESFVHIV
nr:flavin-containing monooxygenase FMO GS-OX4-like [Onthophagus taurus]